MALSIKTQEADRLARELSRLTGETMTEAVTVALRERLERQSADRARRVAELDKLLTEMRANMDPRPITQEEWDWACGEDDLRRGAAPPPVQTPRRRRA